VGHSGESVYFRATSTKRCCDEIARRFLLILLLLPLILIMVLILILILILFLFLFLFLLLALKGFRSPFEAPSKGLASPRIFDDQCNQKTSNLLKMEFAGSSQ